MGYTGPETVNTLINDTTHRLQVSQQILERLLELSFDDDQDTEPEVDLILDPEPSEEMLDEVLSKHNFNDANSSYQYLMDLATERIPFCPKMQTLFGHDRSSLLEAISQTPDPDMTLANLSTVSDSLGGRASCGSCLR